MVETEPTIEITERKIGGVSILDLAGQITSLATQHVLRRKIETLKKGGQYNILLNLANLSRIDIDSLEEIGNNFAALRKASGGLGLVNADNVRIGSSLLTQYLEVISGASLLQPYANETEALNSFALAMAMSKNAGLSFAATQLSGKPEVLVVEFKGSITQGDGAELFRNQMDRLISPHQSFVFDFSGLAEQKPVDHAGQCEISAAALKVRENHGKVASFGSSLALRKSFADASLYALINLCTTLEQAIASLDK
jgi:anti-anti-sigma regulatory factor